MPDSSNSWNVDPPRSYEHDDGRDDHARDLDDRRAPQLRLDVAPLPYVCSRRARQRGMRDHNTDGPDRTGGKSRNPRRNCDNLVLEEAPTRVADENWTPIGCSRMMLFEITRLQPWGDLVPAGSPISSNIAQRERDRWCRPVFHHARFTSIHTIESPPDPLSLSATTAI